MIQVESSICIVKCSPSGYGRCWPSYPINGLINLLAVGIMTYVTTLAQVLDKKNIALCCTL